MFQDLFLAFIKQTLESYTTSTKLNNREGYTIRITSDVDFLYDNDADINANVLFGSSKKIEGAKDSNVAQFSITVYSERNNGGKFTKKIFNNFFNEYSMKSLTIADDDTTYSVFANFGDLLVLDSHVESKNGYRSKFALTGTVIFSESDQIGRNTYIAFPSADDTEETVTWYELQIISPTEVRNNNLESKSTSAGIAYINGAKAFSGKFGTLLKNDTASLKLIKYLHQDETLDNFWLKFQYSNYSKIEKKLKIASITSGIDDNTKNAIITIEYVKDDVYGS